jgi:hypothetical protein
MTWYFVFYSERSFEERSDDLALCSLHSSRASHVRNFTTSIPHPAIASFRY